MNYFSLATAYFDDLDGGYLDTIADDLNQSNSDDQNDLGSTDRRPPPRYRRNGHDLVQDKPGAKESGFGRVNGSPNLIKI